MELQVWEMFLIGTWNIHTSLKNVTLTRFKSSASKTLTLCYTLTQNERLPLLSWAAVSVHFNRGAFCYIRKLKCLAEIFCCLLFLKSLQLGHLQLSKISLSLLPELTKNPPIFLDSSGLTINAKSPNSSDAWTSKKFMLVLKAHWLKSPFLSVAAYLKLFFCKSETLYNLIFAIWELQSASKYFTIHFMIFSKWSA